jgi:hypothetical protein
LTGNDGIRDFLFRALSAEELVDRLESEGVSVRAATDPRAMQRVLPIDDFSQKIRMSAMSALPAYLAFFCIENSVRELINDRMTDVHGPDWWDNKASAPLRNKVTQRREKEGHNRWHIARGAHPIYYTDFGDLGSLLQNNWPDFEDLFPDQNWVLSRIGELELSRNIIAHSNTLDERELIRLRIYLQDWIKQVG